MNVVRAVIIDDEPLSVDKIKRHLEHFPNVDVIGGYYDGNSAIQAIKLKKPDLLFLDIQMPEMNGFEVIKHLNDNELPAIIFITAYDNYALQAFEIYALDYLLKPFDQERFDKAVIRAIETLNQKNNINMLRQQLSELQRHVHPDTKYLDKFVIKAHGRIFFLKTDDIDWIEAAGNYIKVHAGKDTHMVRMTMNGVEEKLNPDDFIRIHRSAIVRFDRIKEIQPWFNGEHVIYLINNQKLSLSRGYRQKLKSVF